MPSKDSSEKPSPYGDIPNPWPDLPSMGYPEIPYPYKDEDLPSMGYPTDLDTHPEITENDPRNDPELVRMAKGDPVHLGLLANYVSAKKASLAAESDPEATEEQKTYEKERLLRAEEELYDYESGNRKSPPTSS